MDDLDFEDSAFSAKKEYLFLKSRIETETKTLVKLLKFIIKRKLNGAGENAAVHSLNEWMYVYYTYMTTINKDSITISSGVKGDYRHFTNDFFNVTISYSEILQNQSYISCSKVKGCIKRIKPLQEKYLKCKELSEMLN